MHKGGWENVVYTVKTEVCIPYLGHAPCNSRGMYFTTSELQGAYPRYGIHTSVFAVYTCAQHTTNMYNYRLALAASIM